MGLTEKTLEINIVSEMLSISNVLGDFLFFEFRRNNPHLPAPAVSTYRSAAVGLSLRAEKKKGYDIEFRHPAALSNRRALFLQFKLGKPKTYCRTNGSRFNKNSSNCVSNRSHYLFGINNNSSKDQHSALQRIEIGGTTGLPGRALYALPRISDEAMLFQNVGSLLHRTTLLDVHEVDALAIRNNLLISIGNSHEVRISPDDTTRELLSDPVDMSSLTNHVFDLFGEITRFNIWRIFELWRESIADGFVTKDGVRAGIVAFEDVLRNYMKVQGTALPDTGQTIETLLYGFAANRIDCVNKIKSFVRKYEEAVESNRWSSPFAEPEQTLIFKMPEEGVHLTEPLDLSPVGLQII